MSYTYPDRLQAAYMSPRKLLVYLHERRGKSRWCANGVNVVDTSIRTQYGVPRIKAIGKPAHSGISEMARS
jgi:hypothetical protein